MNINLRLNYLDGSTKDVSAGAPDIVAFESKFDLSIARLEQNIRMTHLFFMGWNVERRTGATPLDFDAWIETVAGVEMAPAKK